MSQQPQQPPAAQPVVVVTLDAMYRELTDLRGDVRSIKDTLDPAITNLRDTSNDHETRIRALETATTSTTTRDRVIYGIGGFIASGALATVLAYLFH